MYIKIHDKEWICDFVRKTDFLTERLEYILQDRDFDVYIERNTDISINYLGADLVVKRNARGIPVQTLHNRYCVEPDYIEANNAHLIVKGIYEMYRYLNDRKHKHEADKITATELTDTMRAFSSPNDAVYYICNLTTGLISDKRVQFLYKHPAFDKIEFVSDKNSRCTWFYSERDVKNFIAKHRYYLTYNCANSFVVKAVRVGNRVIRTFYNLDLNRECYDLYGPVESCCKRLARYSRIGEDNTGSREGWCSSYSNYFKMDADAVNWSIEYWNKQMKEIMEEMNLPKIKKVIFNNPATIVFWADKSKTIVKCENEEFDPEKGLSMAISKKALGNKHDYYNVFKKWLPKENKEDKNKKPEAKEKKSTNKKKNNK